MRNIYTAALLATLSLPALRAGSIDFELGAPCNFLDTAPLRNAYQSLGVTFDVPGGVPGGAVLNKCAGFGINAHSGTDFLAFNRDAQYPDTTVPIPSQLILFATPVSNISLYVAGLDADTTYTFYGRNNLGVDMTPVSITTTGGKWLQVVLPEANLSWIYLTSPASALLVDDLTWNNPVTEIDGGVPEPGALLLTGAGLLLLALRRRR